jgi:signal peptidase II
MSQTLTMNDVTKKSALKWCWLSLLVLVVDQWTKFAVLNAFALYESKQILPFFNLTLLFNKGAAFSFLSSHPSIAVWLFSGIAIVISVVLLVWLKRLPSTDRWSACALSLILGGGIGNLIDRVYYGYVVDFLDFHLANAHFPAFNIADTAITVGAVMLFLSMFIFKDKR